MKKIESGGRTVEISSRDKTFYPDSGLTKGDILDYYLQIADYILPHLKNRPVTMHRFPDGIGDKEFYQKQAPGYFPGWIDLVKVKNRDGGVTEYVLCNNRETLIYLVNQSSIVIHTWLSKKKRLENPDRMIFDLDPAGDDFEIVKDAAKKLKRLLGDEMNLENYIMTTGSRGLHVVVPLSDYVSFEKSQEFSRFAAEIMVEREPDKFTTNVRKEKRKAKLYIDTARNAFGQTAIAPYSLRALKNAPIATPLEWGELDNPGLDPQTYHIKNIFRRLGQKSDPWKKMGQDRVSLKSLESLLEKFQSQDSN